MAKSLMDMLKEGLLYPKRFLQGRFMKPAMHLDDLKPGSGAIVEAQGEKVAAYKSESGQVTLLSPVCTHLGCLVGWNDTEKTWDCPCHGSRYEPTGEVRNGPTKRPLNKI